MSSEAAEAYFANQFEKDLIAVGEQMNLKYLPIIKAYREIIIPFERSRVNEHQSIIFQNSSLEQNKLEMMNKVQQSKAEIEKLQCALELQRNKINEYQKKIGELQDTNIDNLSVIESLKIRNQDYRQAIEHKNSAIAQLQKDKEVLLVKFQQKDQECTLILNNCIRDKGMLAEKLNALNEMEQGLLEKEKEIKAEQFYIKKQWEKFQEDRNKKQTPKEEKKKEPRIFKSEFFPSARQPIIEDNVYGQEEDNQILKEKEKKDIGPYNSQILRNPLRKLVKHHQSEIYNFSFNSTGTLLSSCGGDRYIKVFDTINLRTVSNIHSNSAESVFISVALDYSGDRILSGSTDKTVSIFNSHTGKHLHSFLGHGNKVNSVAWTNSKEKCASGSDDKQLKIWDIQKASNIFSIGCQKSVKVVRSNNAEQVVYTGHADGSVRVYSINQQNSSPISHIKGIIDYSITSLTLLSNRHQVLVTSNQGTTIHLLDLKMNKAVNKYDHRDFFNSAAQGAISPSEELILSGNCDGSIYYWSRFKGDMVRKVTGHEGPVTAINYNFMSSILATGDKEGSVILWQ